jgi:pSer/pThr/pTyr-binding forkhead associated (FHA) protein
MEDTYGKLTLLNLNGPDHEFMLSKTVVSLGRSNTNDIIINDARVSRSHARLECGQDDITIIDLGSSNGTRVNGAHIQRAILNPGDTINLGSQQLKFQMEDPREDAGMTVIDTQLQLTQTLGNEFLPVEINETSHPSLVVFTGDKTWKIDLVDLDQATIGRDDSSIVYIDAPNVSRQHAEVLRKGNAFVLHDLGSANGTYLRGEKVQHHILQDSDVFQVGPAQIIFKSGFQEQALTIANEQLANLTGRRTVVFAPGLMGSELWLGNERIWPDAKTLFTEPEIYCYPSELPIEPRNIVDEVVIVPNLIKMDQYNRLGDYLVEELNYQRGVDFFEFPYDWRQDVRISAHQLGQLIESIPSQQPIILIGHSLGTMVSRYYVERLGGHKRVEKMILMGGPNKGAIKAIVSMIVAPQVLPFGIMGERMRQICLTFPSSYQILPNYPAGTDQKGTKTNFLEDDRWLDEQYKPLLKIGKDFRNELADTTKIPSVVVIGYGIKTIYDVSVVRDDDGKIHNIEYRSDAIGDSSILELSAYLAGSEIHPVHQNHGSLFVDNDVKMRLKVELTRPY